MKVENGRVLVNVAAPTRRTKKPHAPHPLARKAERAPGPLRLAGISTTAMDAGNPRFSGSDHLLDIALAKAGELGAQTRAHPPQRSEIPRLRGLLFEGRQCVHLALLDHSDG